MATNGLLINKAILQILTGDTSIYNVVENKIYPVVAPDKPEDLSPFVVLERTNINSTYSKDGCLIDDVSVNIYSISNDYKESVELANLIRHRLENIRGNYSNIDINNVVMESCSESFNIDGYITTLTFTIRCK